MPKKKSYLTVTDQFCGCGGSSSGAKKVLDKIGGEIKLALNHWKLAIETHNTNFPDTMHECTDVSACDPRRYPSTDILITSPECTTHSPAGGNRKVLKKQMAMFDNGKIDAAAERSRATMWDVCRFAEYHSYNIIIVENVVEARKWLLFEPWLLAMHKLGYDHRCVYQNSMHHQPTPQSRDRMYVVFWKKGNKPPMLDYTPMAYCIKCTTNIRAIQTWKKPDVHFGKYRQQYLYCCPTCTSIVEPYYFASFNCIDWTDPGTRIGSRLKALSSKTIVRIKFGLNKYGGQPIQLHTAYGETANSVTRSLLDPGFSQTTVPSTAFVVDDKQQSGIGFRVRSLTDPINVIHTDPRLKLVMPFIIKLEHGQNAQSVDDVANAQTARHSQMMINPLPTQTGTQGMGFVVPFLLNRNIGGTARSIDEPVNTATANGVKTAIITPPFIVENKGNSKAKAITDVPGSLTTKQHVGLVTNESWNSFIQAYYGGSIVQSHISEAIKSINTHDRHYLVNYKELEIDECYYRMLKPREIKLAMAFDNGYIVLGSSRDQVKQLGNAVTPPVMQWLIQQCVDSLN